MPLNVNVTNTAVLIIITAIIIIFIIALCVETIHVLKSDRMNIIIATVVLILLLLTMASLLQFIGLFIWFLILYMIMLVLIR